MKKALFLAYYYPPYGGGGVQRTTKYVKYLREYGWEPVVITIRENKIPLWDESLLADVPEGLEIHRTEIWGLTFIEKLLKLRKSKVKAQSKDTTKPETSEAVQGSNQAAQGIASQGIASRVKGFLRPVLRNIFLLVYSFLLYPDDKIGWYPFASRKARERMRQGDIDLIYTTSAPFTAHLIGLYLKKKTGKPWVIDLRDPWAGNKYLIFSDLRKPLDRLIEGWCIRNADQVVTVSEPIREELVRSYPKERADKFIVIPNGYDEEDLFGKKVQGAQETQETLESQEPVNTSELQSITLESQSNQEVDKNYLVFSYTGSFYNEISPKYFLLALDELLKKGSVPKEQIRVQFAGQFGAESLQLISAFQSAHPEVISVSGYVPHSESTQRMLSADILLLFLNKEAGRGVLTGKLFEYLGTHKPVLAMIPEGLASDLIHKAKAGLVVPPEDIAQIHSAILDFYVKWKEGKLVSTTDPEVAGQYSRKALAGRLGQILDKLTR